MNRLSFITLLMSCLIVASCSEKSDYPDGAPEVAIARADGNDTTSLKVTFTPNEYVDHYNYAIGSEEDYDAFVDGTLEGMAIAEGTEPQEITFENLLPDRTYTVYAQGFSAEGFAGGVSMMNTTTKDNELDITMQYVSDVSAGFRLEFTHNYYEVRYYLGTEADRDAFESGELGTYITEPIQDYECVHYFELTPETDYVFYYAGYDRLGIPTIGEIPLTTYATGACAGVTIEPNLNVYESILTVTPNGDAYKMTVAFGEEGFAVHALSNWANDAVAMFRQWGESHNNGTETSVQEPIEISCYTQPYSDSRVEAYILLEDENGNAVSLLHHIYVTHETNPDAGTAEVGVAVSNITSGGAQYTYTPNEYTLGFYYDTIDAEWYDDKVSSGIIEEDPYYIHDYLMTAEEAGKFHYGNDEYVWTEAYGTPNTRYYAVACPMNENGAGEGWGPLAIEEYTTAAQ